MATKRTKPVYSWSRHSYAVSPEVVGDAIDKIARKEGRCEPDALVRVAEPEDHPLHPLFTWDDDDAASKWRVHEARNVINALSITIMVNDQEVTGPAFVSVGHIAKTRDEGEGYRALDVVLHDPEFAQEAMNEAMARLRAIRNRYAALETLAPVWAALDAVAA